MMYRWLIVSLVSVSACAAPSGNFNDLYEPVCFENQETADYVVANDRAAAVAIDKNNRVGKVDC